MTLYDVAADPHQTRDLAADHPDVVADGLARQEALHNVRKHARARRLTVTVEAQDAWVEVVVADDGAGLADPTDPLAGPGFGMRFKHERAAAAGGSLAIASAPTEGTRVTVRVPRREAPAVAQGLPAEAVPPGRGGR